MRGGFLHNRILIGPLEREFRRRGATTHREKATCRGRRTGYIDLLVELGQHRIAVEAERSPKRVHTDLTKAAAVGACELWIVVPDAATADAVRRRLLKLLVVPDRGGWGVFVLTLGQALQRVTDCFPLIPGPNVPGKTNNNVHQEQ